MNKRIYRKVVSLTINSIIKNKIFDFSECVLLFILIGFPVFIGLGKVLTLFKIPVLTIVGATMVVFPLVMLIVLIYNSSKFENIDFFFKQSFNSFIVYHYNPYYYADKNAYLLVFNLMKESHFKDFMKCVKASGKKFYSKEDIKNFDFLDKDFVNTKSYKELKSILDSFFGMLQKNEDSFENKKTYNHSTKNYEYKPKYSKLDECLRYFNLSKNDLSKDTIKSAYRKKVKEVHPDSKNGSEEEFKKATDFYNYLNSTL